MAEPKFPRPPPLLPLQAPSELPTVPKMKKTLTATITSHDRDIVSFPLIFHWNWRPICSPLFSSA
jgi:hypothetical protein